MFGVPWIDIILQTFLVMFAPLGIIISATFQKDAIWVQKSFSFIYSSWRNSNINELVFPFHAI